ncbi:hypothetical protein BBD41_12705 [Paenibacillus ihbetae]|uniref:Glycosyl transferase family 28 C-terminal domain-containing protein n=1 Tax=Paenibacillus ihbetae TaxID=1870820 RepID=A0A1B2E044_9BACL|nr:hypothetical protein BBD41_12705 [Paenibacillus ihbetae]
MIFVTVGSQRFPFPRLFQMVDQLIRDRVITGKVIAQVGYTDYQSDNMDIHQFLQESEMKECIRNSDIIVTHAGIGTITQCLESGKKIIVVPRKRELGEHVDNHQIEIANVFRDKKLITVANSQQEIQTIIEHMDSIHLQNYVRPESELVLALKQYVDQL